MEYYAGIDVSFESASLCVVDATGRNVREAKVASEPETLIEWFRGLGIAVTRIGLEAGPLSQWLYPSIDCLCNWKAGASHVQAQSTQKRGRCRPDAKNSGRALRALGRDYAFSQTGLRKSGPCGAV